MGCISSTLRHRKKTDAPTELWRLLDSPKFHVNMLGNSGQTPLMLAMQYNTNMISKLMSYKDLDVNIEDRTGKTVLMHLIDGQATIDNTKLVRIIVEHQSYKANQVHEVQGNPLCSCGITACTDLMYAIINKRDDVANILLNLDDTDVNLEDSDGHTALTHVLHRSFYYWESITTLICKIVQHDSYEVNKYHSDGTIDITNAVKLSKLKPGHDEVLGVLLLQPGVDINLRDHTGDTIYEMALDSNDFGLLDQLLHYPELNRKVLNTVDVSGRNILHHALLHYITVKDKDLKYENIDNFTKEILGCPLLNVSAKDIEGKSPLVHILSSSKGAIPASIINKVIFHPKYQPNQTYYDGYVDILRTAQKLSSPVAVTVLINLVELDEVDVMVSDTKGTILRYVQRAMVANNCSPKIKSDLKLIQQKVIKHGSYDVNREFNGKCNDLLWAAGNGYWDLVEDLIQLPESDVNSRISLCSDVKEIEKYLKSKCTKGMTVLHLACKYGDRNSPLVCKLLQNDKIDVNIQDSEGYTCLMYAVVHQNLYAVQAILSHSSICDISLKNNLKQTVTDIVKANEEIDPMISSLINQGKKFINTEGIKEWGQEISKSTNCLLSSPESPRYDYSKPANPWDVTIDVVDIDSFTVNRCKQTSQSMMISELHHRKLLGNQSFLCEHLSPNEVLQQMLKSDLLTKDKVNELLSAGTRRNIVMKLLSLLLKNNSNIYMTFIDALRVTGQSYVADELEAFNPVELFS